MKVYELMKLAKENPEKYKNKKYKITDGAGYCFIPCTNEPIIVNKIFINEKGILCDEDNKFLYVFFSSFTEAEEIIEYVDFITAIKAFDDCKSIYCKLDNHIYKYSGIFHLSDQNNGVITKEQILKGQWYIQD